MELNISGGMALRNFTRALSCLARFGEELDFIAANDKLSISTVNSSRTAFGVVSFYPRFFVEYALDDPSKQFKFSVTGKALLSPLKPRSANTIESCSIAVGSEDPGSLLEPGVDAGACRIVIRLHCQHGVVKTHRLTYGNPNVNNWARFHREQSTSSWTASSKVLKEWTDHFYLRSGANASTDEITFYCGPIACRLRSFNDTSSEQNISENDLIASRPLTTELVVDVEDFDNYDVPDEQIITFALKEFKAIIVLADLLSVPISAYFTHGGRPLMIQLAGDHFETRFVVATTDYDSGSAGSSAERGLKRETSDSGSVPPPPVHARGGGGARSSGRTNANAAAGPSRASGMGSGATSSNRPLFNPAPTPSPAPHHVFPDNNDDEFDFGGMGEQDLFNDPDAAFAEIDQLSQVPPTGAGAGTQGRGGGGGDGDERARVLVRDTSELERATGRDEEEQDEDEYEAMGGTPGPRTTQLGPTQMGMEGEERAVKKARWNLLGDG
ncbi:hypothetical protein JCM1841_006390 [Sporobolomyces salmonicolor]